MDSISLQLAIKCASKSEKLKLTQKMIDEFVDWQRNEELKEIKSLLTSCASFPACSASSLSLSLTTASTISFLSTTEEMKSIRSKV